MKFEKLDRQVIYKIFIMNQKIKFVWPNYYHHTIAEYL